MSPYDNNNEDDLEFYLNEDTEDCDSENGVTREEAAACLAFRLQPIDPRITTESILESSFGNGLVDILLEGKIVAVFSKPKNDKTTKSSNKKIPKS